MFNLSVAAVITLNALLLGFEADLGLLSARGPQWQSLDTDLSAFSVDTSLRQDVHMGVREGLTNDQTLKGELQKVMDDKLPKDHKLPQDYDLQGELTLDEETPSTLDVGAYTICEYAFVLFFIVELAIRFCDVGCRQYMATPYCKFELCVICFAFVDLSLPLAPDSYVPTAGAAMLFSLLRLTRVLRVVRIFWLCRELRLTGQAFTTALAVVMWIGILLVVVNFLLAIVLTSLIGQTAHRWEKNSEEVAIWFGSVGSTMQTLFTIMTLSGWDRLASVLAEVIPRFVVVPAIVVYIMACCFAMISLISGVVSDSFIAAQRDDEKRDLIQLEDGWHEFSSRFSTLLSSCSHRRSGHLSRDEFCEALEANPIVLKKLSKLDMRASNEELLHIFDRLVPDAAHDGVVEIDSLVEAVSHQSGIAKASGVFDLKYALAATRRETSASISRGNIEVVSKMSEVKSGTTAVEVHIVKVQQQLDKSQQEIAAVRRDLAAVAEALKGLKKSEDDAARERRDLNTRLETVASLINVQAKATERVDEKVGTLQTQFVGQLASQSSTNEKIGKLTEQLVATATVDAQKMASLTSQLDAVAAQLELLKKTKEADESTPIRQTPKERSQTEATDMDLYVVAEPSSCSAAAASEPAAEPPARKEDKERPASEPETTAEPESEVASTVSGTQTVTSITTGADSMAFEARRSI